MGFLTTHVLDTAKGCPGEGIRVELFIREGDNRRLLVSAKTNQDGRCDQPILGEADFKAGQYELLFHVGAYFEGQNIDLPSPKFLDIIPIYFGISDEDSHYHVPLLVSPFGFSTYRGS
jgi:5-hydroxyisourate hydrolase